jgi:hypothetical protein
MGLTDAHISGLDRGSGPTSVSRRRLAGRRTPGGEAAEFKREIEAVEEIEAFMVTLGVLALTRHLHAAAPHQNSHDLLYLL